MLIYLLINKKNGKKYVGQTSKCFFKRLSGHLKERPGRPVTFAISKYGLKNFDYKILAHAEDKESLDFLEKLYISVHQSLSPQGYNLTDGGSRGAHSPETKAKLSRIAIARFKDPVKRKEFNELMKEVKSNPSYGAAISRGKLGKKGRPIPRAERDKLSNERKGSGNSFFGREHTLEHKIYISELISLIKLNPIKYRSQEGRQQIRLIARLRARLALRSQ